MTGTVRRSFDTPDDTVDVVEKVRLDTVEVGGVRLTRVTADPGWRWSTHSKPVQQTETCQVDHLLYLVSGRVGSKDSAGVETEFAAGDLAHVPPGHDGWTVGDEAAVWIELPH